MLANQHSLAALWKSLELLDSRAVDFALTALILRLLQGYGLDYDENYRSLPVVGVLKPALYQ